MFGQVRSSKGTCWAYVVRLNLGSVNVAHSDDNGKTWPQTPVQAGLPTDDRYRQVSQAIPATG